MYWSRLSIVAAAMGTLMFFSASAPAEEIVLSTGDRLSAPITERTDDSITIKHAILGVLTIPLHTVASIDGQWIGEAAEVVPVPQTAPPVVEQAPPPPPPVSVVESLPEPHWDTKLELGFTGNSGNTETANFRIAITSARETETNLLVLDAWYQMSSSDGDRTENRFSTGILSEWPQPGEHYSYFAAARYDNAEFLSWEQRVTANGGLKYYFIDRKKLNEAGEPVSAYSLAGRIGAGIRKEWASNNEDLIPEGLLGFDVDWMISPDQNLQFTTTYYPDMSELGEFRWVNTFDWILAMHHMDGISLKFGLLHEYQSVVDVGIEKNDLYVHASLVVDF